MHYIGIYDIKYCRWCSKRYGAHKPVGRDGFCSAAHKQAHHRAWTKYVTATDGPRSSAKKS